MTDAPAARVAVLLSTYNGARFLPEQLDSLRAQTYRDWMLLWRDDGSSDTSAALMEAFGGPATRIGVPSGHLGARESFLALLRAAVQRLGPGDAVAYADQDDVWLPEKLARGVAALATVDACKPAMVCTRQILVDATLGRIGESPPLLRPPGFPAALTQNIATGCTVLLNHAAAALVAASHAPDTSLHDWWSYVLVTAAGGQVLVDQTPLVLYRQHGGNSVGAPGGTWRRAVAALRRGPATYMGVLRGHVAALAEQPDLLSHDARIEVAALHAALAGGMARRLRALATPGLQRQTWLETLMFRLWFLFG